MVGTGDYQKIAKVLTKVEQREIVNEVSIIPEFIADEAIPLYVDKKIRCFSQDYWGLWL